jgi:sodium-dependent phosphate transporter
MGFSLVAKGHDSIDWETARKIFMSWVISPCASGVCGFIFFITVKFAVMESENSFQRAFYTFPIVLTIFIGIDLFYILYKGFNNKDFADDFTLKSVLPWSFGTGAIFGLIWIFVLGPIAMKRAIAHVEADEEKKAKKLEAEEKKAAGEEEVVEGEENDKDAVVKDTVVKTEAPAEAPEVKKGLMEQFADKTFRQDLEAQSFHENARSAEIWDEFSKYDPKTEQLFTYVQVFTACLNAFAHGANDVANAIAPLSAMLLIYRTGELASKSPVETWILAYGGAGIVLGLLIFGYRVMKSIGYKLTGLSPSRGACAELAASLFVVTASYMEIPVSSTQSIIGAVAGVGLVGGPKNVQWLFLLRVLVAWVVVFACAVGLEAAIFSMFAFTPKLD